MSESKFREITVTLKHLEMEEDRKGQKKFEEACCELERKQRCEVQTNTAMANDHRESFGNNPYADNAALSQGFGNESDIKP